MHQIATHTLEVVLIVGIVASLAIEAGVIWVYHKRDSRR